MTGHGLKDPDNAIKSAGREPIVTPADKQSVRRAIGL
jgi:hypothetical protein